jgi:MFS superfamily sulfate permease-like transporter
MLFLVGVELAKLATDVRAKVDLAVLCVTVVVSVVVNTALGLMVGAAVHYLAAWFRRRSVPTG